MLGAAKPILLLLGDMFVIPYYNTFVKTIILAFMVILTKGTSQGRLLYDKYASISLR